MRQALTTPAFWLALLGLVLLASVADAVIIHQIPILIWQGIDQQTAALYLSSMFFSALPLRFGPSLAADYVSARNSLCAGMRVGGPGTLCLFFFGGTSAALVFVLGLDAVEGIATSNWLVIGEYFGRKSFGSLVGIMTVFHSMGWLISPVISGWVFDATQSHNIVLLSGAPLFLLGGLAFLNTRRPHLNNTPIGH